MPRPAPARRCFLADSDPASRQGILAAALALFARHGLDGTTIRMIGDEAGYTNPAMFKFFASKEALALHLFERCYGWLHGGVAAAVTVKPFDDALRAVVGALAGAMDEDLEAVLFVQDSLRELWPRLPAAARSRSIVGELRGLFARGIRDGAVVGYASPDVPVAILLGTLAQLARMAYFGELPGGPARWRGELELALGRMLGGAAAPGRRRPQRRRA